MMVVEGQEVFDHSDLKLIIFKLSPITVQFMPKSGMHPTAEKQATLGSWEKAWVR